MLASKKERAEVLSAISESAFPLLIRAHDEEKLSDIAKECFEKDMYAEKIYGLLYPQNRAEKNENVREKTPNGVFLIFLK